MPSIFQTGLMITAIGMGLVFAAIILLWVLMILLVRFGADQTPTTKTVSGKATTNTMDLIEINPEIIAAMAVALALSEKNTSFFVLPPGEAASTWKQVQRTRLLQEKSHLNTARFFRRM